MVRRGMETSLLTTPTLYNINIMDDILASVKFINEYFYNPNLYTVGIYMGAGVVIQNSGLAGKEWPFKA